LHLCRSIHRTQTAGLSGSFFWRRFGAFLSNEDSGATRTRAEEYRRRAQECLDLARKISLERDRAVVLDIAQSWLRLAEQQEAQGPVIQQPQQQQTTLPGAGAAILAAPLLLRPLPDPFVNGRAALVAFAGVSALLALALVSLE
jgi:hypothetical protein